MIKLHSRATVMKRKFTSLLGIVCRHPCLSLILKLFSVIDLAKKAEMDYDNLVPRVSHLTAPEASEERPWHTLVTCLQTINLFKGSVS